MQQGQAGTRGEVLTLLRQTPRTVAELSDALAISGNAVRQHLSSLAREGLVEETDRRRQTRGKPASLYRLTPAGEERFPKAYAPVLSGLLAGLERRLGADEVRSLLFDLGRETARALADGPAVGPMSERFDLARSVLAQLGGDVRVEATPEGGWMVLGAGCPLSGVVAADPAACAIVEGMLAELTGRSVRECCDRAGRPRCAFRVGA